MRGRDSRQPPRLAEGLMRWVLPPGTFGEAVLGDLAEEFQRCSRERSPWLARQWYRAQAVRLSARFLRRRLRGNRGGSTHRSSRRPAPELLRNRLQDLRYAMRTLRKRPAFSVTAVLTLAIGIGSTTAVFSVVHGVLLRPLPYPDSHELVSLWTRFLPESGFDFVQFTVSPPEYFDYRDGNRTMETVAAFTQGGATLAEGDGDPERVFGAQVTANLFDVLRVSPQLGRPLVAGDDDPDAAPVVVLGHGLWQRRFGGDPSIVGRTIEITGRSYEVVGVMPPGFAFPRSGAELWTNARFDPSQLTNRASHFLRLIARRRAGVTAADVAAELETMMAAWEERFPNIHTGHFLFARPYLDDVVGDVRGTLVLLLGAVGFVLLLVCANVANLSLAVGEGRRRELALRAALGAGRRRLTAQLLTESLVLSALGGSLGLLMAVGMTKWVALSQVGIPRTEVVAIDGYVLGFTALVVLGTSFVFGVGPALQVTTRAPQQALRDTGGSIGGGRHLLRKGLIVTELAFSILLVLGAGLMVRSFRNLVGEDLGFVPDSVLIASVVLPPGEYDPERGLAFFRDVLEEIQALPTVRRVSTISHPPVQLSRGYEDFGIQGRSAVGPGEPALNASNVGVRPEYFSAMGIPVLRGRAIEATDRPGTEPVIVINESMARKYWPDGDPIGQRIRFGVCDGPCPWHTIVGIVGDVKAAGPGQPPSPTFYFAAEQSIANPFLASYARFGWFVMKVAGDPLRIAPAVRAIIHRADPALPITTLEPMSDVVAGAVARPRFIFTLLAFFAAVALVLAAVGVYGVMSYHVAQRRGEIGVRIALGARGADVARLVLSQGMSLAALGIAIGLGSAVGLTRFMEGLLFNVSRTDPATFGVVAGILAATALAAAFFPARRATRVDPMTAMRAE